MSTPLNNQASVKYLYNNNNSSGSANSNTVTTHLLDQYTLSASKSALSPTFRPGENISYVVRVVNNGSGDLYTVTVSDDLGGGGASAPLVYQTGSLRVFVDGAPVTVTPDSQPGALTVVLPAPLPAGSSAILVYTSQVRSDIPFSLQSITNTAQVNARGGSASGTVLSVTPSPSATITREAYAELCIHKEADKQTIMPGDTLTYTFVLTNQGNEDAQSVTLTDTLPTGFHVTRVTVNTDGVTTVLDPSQFTVDSNNTITIPNSSGPSIRVPAATSTAPGVTTVTIAGTVSSS